MTHQDLSSPFMSIDEFDAISDPTADLTDRRFTMIRDHMVNMLADFGSLVPDIEDVAEPGDWYYSTRNFHMGMSPYSLGDFCFWFINLEGSLVRLGVEMYEQASDLSSEFVMYVTVNGVRQQSTHGIDWNAGTMDYIETLMAVYINI